MITCQCTVLYKLILLLMPWCVQSIFQLLELSYKNLMKIWHLCNQQASFMEMFSLFFWFCNRIVQFTFRGYIIYPFFSSVSDAVSEWLRCRWFLLLHHRELQVGIKFHFDNLFDDQNYLYITLSRWIMVPSYFANYLLRL